MYGVTVSNTCGTGFAEIKVVGTDCKMDFQSAFTPNNDGKNDRFGRLYPHRVADFQLSIFDRMVNWFFKQRIIKQDGTD